MALIKCPECEKEVSSMAGSCPHCGYPMDLIQSNEEPLDEKTIIDNLDPIAKGKGEIFIEEENEYKSAMLFLCNDKLIVTDINEEKIILCLLYDSYKDLDYKSPYPRKQGGFLRDSSIKVFWNKLTKEETPKFKFIDKLSSNQFDKDYFSYHFNNSFKDTQPVIKCPTCQSTNTKKISGASKAGSALVWGVLAVGKISQTFECKSCGYRW